MVASTLERLTASDMFLLLWDDFGWSGDIGGLAILEAPACSTARVASGSRTSAAIWR